MHCTVFTTLLTCLKFHAFSPLISNFSDDSYGYALYDWYDVRGESMDFDLYPWAIGSNYTVDLPYAQTLGNATLSIDDQALSDLSDAALTAGTIDMMLVSFGDNANISFFLLPVLSKTKAPVP